MLPEEQKRKGVISASLGNHALALCYHSKRLGIPVTVVMPIVAPIMKIQSCQQLGANVVVQGHDMGEAKQIAMKLSKEKGLVYINGYKINLNLHARTTFLKGMNAIIPFCNSINSSDQ